MKAQLPLTYENYIFDLYGTLVDIHTDEELPELWEKMSLFYGYYGARYTAEDLRQAWNSQTRRCRGQSYEAFPEIDLTVVIRALFEQKNRTPSPELCMHTGQFFRILSTEYIRLYEGTQKLLSSLHSAGKKVWLLSNAQRIFTQYELQMLDIDHCFDGILISSDYGFSKPDPRFFQQLTSRFSVDFRSSLFIGNDAVNDIGGARNVGLDSFYVHSNLSFITPEWLPQEDVTKSRFPGAVSAPVCFQLGDTRNYTFMNFTGWEIG